MAALPFGLKPRHVNVGESGLGDKKTLAAYNGLCFTLKRGRATMMKSSLKIPPHLKRVTTLPCEMSSTGTIQY